MVKGHVRIAMLFLLHISPMYNLAFETATDANTVNLQALESLAPSAGFSTIGSSGEKFRLTPLTQCLSSVGVG